MKKAILLFNGIHFPLAITERAISWAKKNKGTLLDIFVIAEKENDTLSEEAGDRDFAIIANNIRMMRHQAKISQVELETHILATPSEEELNQWLQKAGHVFTSENALTPSLLSIEPEKMEAALSQSEANIEWIRE